MLSDDFDEIELGALPPQMEKECLVTDEPVVQCVAVDARVVEHDYGGAAIALPDQRVEKLDNVGTFFRRGTRDVDKLFSSRSSVPTTLCLQCLLGSILRGKPRGDQPR